MGYVTTARVRGILPHPVKKVPAAMRPWETGTGTGTCCTAAAYRVLFDRLS